MTFDDVDMRAVAILIAALGAQIGDDAPATQALRDFMQERTEQAWDTARRLFNRLPGRQRRHIADGAVALATQLKQSDGGVLNLLRTMGKRKAGAAPAAGVMDWMDGEKAPEQPKKRPPSGPTGPARERVWR